MKTTIYFVPADKNGASFIYDSLIARGWDVDTVQLNQMPYNCNDTRTSIPSYNLNSITDDNFIIVGGFNANPVACELVNRGLLAPLANPNEGYIAGVTIPNGNIGWVIWGLNARETAFALYKFVALSNPYQSTIFPVPSDFGDLVLFASPFIDEENVGQSTLLSRFRNGWNNSLTQLQSEQIFQDGIFADGRLDFWDALSITPLGTVGVGGKLALGAAKSGLVKMGGKSLVSNAIGKSGFIAKAWGIAKNTATNINFKAWGKLARRVLYGGAGIVGGPIVIEKLLDLYADYQAKTLATDSDKERLQDIQAKIDTHCNPSDPEYDAVYCNYLRKEEQLILDRLQQADECDIFCQAEKVAKYILWGSVIGLGGWLVVKNLPKGGSSSTLKIETNSKQTSNKRKKRKRK